MTFQMALQRDDCWLPLISYRNSLQTGADDDTLSVISGMSRSSARSRKSRSTTASKRKLPEGACVFISTLYDFDKCLWGLNQLCRSVSVETSCSSSDVSAWVGRIQAAPHTPMMMSSPHIVSTVLREPKKPRPEQGYMGVYSMSNEAQQQTLQQQTLQQAQQHMDYK